MTIAVLYVTLCAAAYYLLARAKVTEWLWSRYPDWLDYWTSCAACAGFWYGLGCGLLGAQYDLALFGLTPDHWLTIAAAAALGMVWTPVVAFAQVYSWVNLLPGADEPEPEPDPRQEPTNLRAL
jgi:hypothetical protein